VFIDLIKCEKCGRTGRPGEAGFRTTGKSDTVLCDCGNALGVESLRDQSILSVNAFCRLMGASNHLQCGELSIVPGRIARVTFQQPFDYPCRAYLTPVGGVIFVKELSLRRDGMIILSSHENQPVSSEPISLNWLVYGLIEIDNLPSWYVHFYSGVSNAQNGLYKPALLDYAVSFEAFMENFLRVHLTRRYDQQIAEYLLDRTTHIQDRCKKILEIAIGHRLSERTDLYQPWDNHVREPRNRLMHGEKIPIDKNAVEKAHQAVYQAIRWIQSLVGESLPFRGVTLPTGQFAQSGTISS